MEFSEIFKSSQVIDGERELKIDLNNNRSSKPAVDGSIPSGRAILWLGITGGMFG